MFKRNWKIFFVGISQLTDYMAIAASGAVVFWLKEYPRIGSHTDNVNLWAFLIVFALAYITIAVMMGLYRGSFHLSLSLQNMIMIRGYILTTLVTVMIATFANSLFVDRRAIIEFLAPLPFFFVMGRILLRRLNLLFQRLGYGVHNSLIVGYEHDAFNIYRRFSSLPELGYKVRGFVTQKVNPSSSLQPQFTFDQLEQAIENYSIDRVFIPTGEMIVNGYANLKRISEKHGIKLKILSPHAEELLKIARIYDIAGITLTTPPRYHVNAIKLFFKRVFDIVGASIAIILFSPIFLITVIAIWIDTGLPVFFLQRRTSVKGGKEFDFIKFRSMTTNAEQIKEKLLDDNESDGALFKMKNDPRITRVGNVIRKLSIDELPQLFNVLKGDMSLVGPRPLPLSDIDKLDESDEFWETVQDRAAVKPGMTGLWQVSGRSDVKFREMILLDLYYVENYSLMFDLEIMFETVPVVLFGKGAY